MSNGDREEKTITFYVGSNSTSSSGSSDYAIVGVRDGDVISSPVAVEGQTRFAMDKVVFAIDDNFVKQAGAAPYSRAGDKNGVLYPFDFSYLEDGEHTLTIRFYGKGREQVDKHVNFFIGAPTTSAAPPAPTSSANISVKLLSQSSSGRVKIGVKLEARKHVSLAVYDSNDVMLRDLLRGKLLAAGSHTVIWDGLDRDGNAVGSGDVVIKALGSNGLTTEYVTSLGTSPLSGGHDHWVGNIGGGGSAIARDESGLYFAAGASETPALIVKTDLTGSKELWRAKRYVASDAFNGAISLGVGATGLVYILNEDAQVTAVNAKTGRQEYLKETSRSNDDGMLDVLPHTVDRGAVDKEIMTNMFLHTKEKYRL